MGKCIRGLAKQRERLKNCGGVKGVLKKLDYKRREAKALKKLGTKSFPDQPTAARQREETFARRVRFSILVPVYNTPLDFLREMIESVLRQTYENWQLCLADGSDGAHGAVGELCLAYAEKDGRICYRKLAENRGIAANTNECLGMAEGEYIGLLDHDDILHPCALYEYVRVINEQDADYLYCDEAVFQDGHLDKIVNTHFKPDYAPDNLRANNYICHFSVFSRKLLEGTELFRTRFDGSQDHDMILRLTDRARRVAHVPKLLYYWRRHTQSVSSGIEAKPYAIEGARGAIAEHLRAHGFENFEIESTRAFATIFRIRYQIIGSPKITIVIANRDHAADLRRCVSSVLEKSTYTNYEIVIVENNSSTEEIFALYRELQEKGGGRVRVVAYEGAFNYAAVNNLGVRHAEGAYVLLLNNDTQVITPGWMEEMLMYAQRGDVGAVGAKLFYGDGTIQHGGVVIGLGAHGTAGHVHYKMPRLSLGYMGRLCYAQNMTAVTGACLLVKKSLYEQVGGLEEAFAVSLNDVDFCLKLRQAGCLNVFTPFAELYHFESASRGLDDRGEKAERYAREAELFRKKWEKQLRAGDPYFNPNFSLDRSDFSLKI